MSAPLDPLALPLSGLRLIEASAGTGKTWTLATLVLRALLEPPHYELPQLLVLTFTEAATAELRTRIRARLIEARAALDGAASLDPTLAALCARLPDPAAARARIAAALARFDEAQISTIHSFCARTLAEHAFAAGVDFEAETLTDTSALDAEILADFWRARCAQAGAAEMRWLLGACPDGPRSLAAAVLPVALRRPGVVLHPAPPAPAQLAALEAALHEAATAFASAWPEAREAAAAAIVAAREARALSTSNDKGYSEARLPPVLAAADAFAAGPDAALPKALHWLRSDVLAGSLLKRARDKGALPPAHPVFELCRRLHEADAALSGVRHVALVHAAREFLLAERSARKAARALRGFDDQLTMLADALYGPAGKALADALARAFPLALVDEFQDTDPAQWRIFRRIYADRPDTALLLIGDPKQAIYAFRGADVYTYLAARRLVPEDRRHTLTTNHRSVAPLVAAVNTLFQAHDRTFVEEGFAFEPAVPAGRAEDKPLQVDGDAEAPFRVWWLPGDGTLKNGHPKATTKSEATRLAVAAVAADVARLLRAAVAGEATLGDRPLAGRDIGILVNTHREAQQVQAALRRLGVGSVALSRASVYASPEAAGLVLLLEAVARPADGAAVRAALGSGLIGLDAAALAGLAADEGAWGTWAECFAAARERLSQGGVMPMLLGLMDEAGITAQLLGYGDGGRALTNLLHLGELLAAEPAAAQGPDALLRTFRAALGRADGNVEAQQLRLESDEALVRVVTVHAAKGLQWPLVYLPFAWSEKVPEAKPPHLHHASDSLALHADLGSDDADAARLAALREALAEQARRLYVAMTRASHRCVLVCGAVAQAEYGALAWLLHPTPGAQPGSAASGGPPWSVQATLGDATQRARWQALVEASGRALVLRELDGDAAQAQAGAEAAAAAGPPGRAQPFTGRIARDWRITSFTGLSAGRAQAPDRPDHDALDAPDCDAEVTASPEAPHWSIARFPRGAAAGTCLHGLFEVLDFPAAHGGALAGAVAQALRRAGYPPDWQETVEALVCNVLDTPLDGSGFTLRTIERSRRRDELEFYFPLAPLTDGRLNAVLGARADFADVPALRFEPVRGVLKGYVDLVFEHAGQFYFADYKSNWLGTDAAAYHPAALADVMAEHRYDLQYLLYTVALHRHLAMRLPGYDYATHFGGVYYLFLRGMVPAHGARTGVFYDRPDAALIGALEAVLCRAEQA